MVSQNKSTATRRVYGRRQGHRLRSRQQRLLEERLPGLRLDLADLPGEPLNPTTLFGPPPGEVWLEIGFGAGEHLAAQAAAHPATGFIGCEPYITGIARLLARIDDQGLANIRIFSGDARELLEKLAEASIARTFLLFPDPWPKRRHWKRRFVQPESLDLLARAMAAGSELRIATDMPDYARWTLAHIHQHPDFAWCAQRAHDWRARPQDWPETRYEQKAKTAGRRPVYLSFKRCPRR